MPFSETVLAHPEVRGRGPAILARIEIGKRRIQSVLDSNIIAHQKTLEQKISDQGPRDQRVDPHLLGLAKVDLMELNRLRSVKHASTGNIPWFVNIGTAPERYTSKLDDLASLYATITHGGFGNLIGDALEVIVFKCLQATASLEPRFSFHGHFYLSGPKNSQRRFRKVPPPKTISGFETKKEPDFIQYGHPAGPLCIECKNYREWAYPRESYLKELIIKADELNSIPVLVARRIQYATRTNLLEPAGIIAHESLLQYYPSDQTALAERVKHRRSLGFTDVTATEDPNPRTLNFFQHILPRIVPHMSERWNAHRSALTSYATGAINLAQLYNAIGSRAGGNWLEGAEYRKGGGDEDIPF